MFLFCKCKKSTFKRLPFYLKCISLCNFLIVDSYSQESQVTFRPTALLGHPVIVFLSPGTAKTGARGCARPSRFWQIRPLFNQGGSLCPPDYYLPLQIFRSSDIPDESMKCEMNVFFASPLICRQRGMQTDKYMRQKDEFIFLARPDSHCVHFTIYFSEL